MFQTKGFREFEFRKFEFVSEFDIRISDSSTAKPFWFRLCGLEPYETISYLRIIGEKPLTALSAPVE